MNGLLRKVVTAFCVTCNARDRVIDNGRCVICRNQPNDLNGERDKGGEA